MPHAAPPKILALTVARYTDRQGVVRKPLEFGYALMYHGMRYRLAGGRRCHFSVLVFIDPTTTSFHIIDSHLPTWQRCHHGSLYKYSLSSR